jgi:hypothetical protein
MRSRFAGCAVAALLIFTISCLLNFVWEAVHSVYLFEGHDFSAARYVKMVSSASVRDALIILAMYFGVAAASRRFLWGVGGERKWGWTFFLIGLVVAAAIEYRAVYLAGTWAYNSDMPTIFGIGLSPLIQLSVTGILAIRIAAGLTCPKGIRPAQ